MAVLGSNTCAPTRIYGPLPQTLFCGCSIIGLSVQGGWNEQSSSVTVELVQDTCVGPKVWYDGNMFRQSGNIADPGFTYPEPGVPAYLRIEENSGAIGVGQNRGGFEYAGLIEGWNERKDPNGNPVFSVRLVDPRAILENVQLILGDYPGRTRPRNSIQSIYNIINVYGFLEYLGSYQGKPCPSSPAGGIGGVTAGNVLGFYNGNPIGLIANEQGMSWTDIRCAIQTLTSLPVPLRARPDFDFFCKGQSIFYVGATTGGYGILNADTTLQGVGIGLSNKASRYIIDLTELPFAPLYYKVSGPQATLLEVISQICADAGYDYYCELQIVRQSSFTQRIVKVRVAKRGSAPQWGKLQEFINTKISQATSANGGVISYTTGAELRNEVTSNFLIGGNVRTPYFVSPPALMPYWGLDADGYLIEAYTTGFNSEWQVAIDASRLNATLYTPFAGRFPIISERELRASLADIDSWLSITFLVGGTVYNHLLSIGINGSSLNFDTLAGASINNATINSIPKAIWSNGNNFAEQEAVDVETIYNFIKSYADEFYGKQFLVSANFVCYAIDYAPALASFGAKAKFRYSHLPSTEGGWVEDNFHNVIGMNHPSSATDFFRDEVGKFQPILKFNMYGSPLLNGAGSVPCSPAYLSTDEYLINTDGGTGEVWCKADIEPYWIHGIPTNTAGNYISAVLKISAPIVQTVSDFDQTGASFGGLGMIRNNQAVSGAPQYISPSPFVVQILNKAVLPIYAVVPVLSNVDSYGPWGVNGLPGQTNLEIDESFVPWEFGSNTLMGVAALDKVNSSASNTRKTERGTITVAGFPNLPLGCEIMAADTSNAPFASQFNRQRYFETRQVFSGNCTALANYYYVQMNVWEGIYGPNITGINCNIGADGFTTTYEFNTYTPVYGRFNKNNAERLKQIGQSRLSLSRTMRSKALLRDVVQTKRSMMNSISSRFLKGTSSKAPNSPHSVMVGNYTNDGRVNAFSNPIKDMPYSFSSEAAYSTAAMMSFDGLYRPVSKNGSGGLPQFINSSQNCVKAFTTPPDPPQVAKLNISRTGLDPLANPSDSLVTSNNSTSGHDIDVVAKGSTLTGNYYTTKEGGYANDYRFWALKGPIVIQGWGYDIEGKPVPNAADSEGAAEGGSFTSSNLEDKFLTDWLQKPKTWPVAPLDLRLDRERGVWTIPSNFRNLHVTPTGECVKSNKRVNINNAKPGTKGDGSPLPNTGEVEWPWTIKPPKNVGKIPAYYDAYDCKYYAFPTNRLDVDQLNNTCTGNSSELVGNYSDIKNLQFEYPLLVTSVENGDCGQSVKVELGNFEVLPSYEFADYVLSISGNCLVKIPLDECVCPPVDRPYDYGDIIVEQLAGGSGQIWSIAQNSVEFHEIQKINPYKILGRYSPSIGNVQEINYNPAMSGLLDSNGTSNARGFLNVYSKSESIVTALIFG